MEFVRQSLPLCDKTRSGGNRSQRVPGAQNFVVLRSLAPRSRIQQSADERCRTALATSSPAGKIRDGARVGEECQLLSRASQETGQRVVVLRANGIELVIVAAGTRDAQTEEGFPHHVDLIVEPVALLGTQI